MNAKISVFVISIEAIILHNLHKCTFKPTTFSVQRPCSAIKCLRIDLKLKSNQNTSKVLVLQLLASVPFRRIFTLSSYKRKYPSKHLLVLKKSSTRLQRNNFTSSKTSCRRLEDILQDFLEDEKLFC